VDAVRVERQVRAVLSPGEFESAYERGLGMPPDALAALISRGTH
jgi:hypothetical protein